MVSCGGRLVEPMPPSGTGPFGVAADAYVPTNPSIRTEILIMCFMGVLLPRRQLSQIGTKRRGENYKARVKSFCELDLRGITPISLVRLAILFCASLDVLVNTVKSVGYQSNSDGRVSES
jgi:hypothetical protein